jgi:7-carboxy-7-deazaguanine synthase
MFGNNPLRAPEKGDGTELFVQDIFLTIQGEGPYAGQTALFIRLGGCNLACKFCDTEFESFTKMSLDKIIKKSKSEIEQYNCRLCVITGGEPFRQNISKLCEQLHLLGMKIQVETNGTLYCEVPEYVEAVCSPKISNRKYYEIREDLKKHIIAYKFLVSSDITGYDHVPSWDFGNAKVYVQGIDQIDSEKNIKNNILAMDIVKKNGYILSVQTHKILGIK